MMYAIKGTITRPNMKDNYHHILQSGDNKGTSIIIFIYFKVSFVFESKGYFLRY